MLFAAIDPFMTEEIVSCRPRHLLSPGRDAGAMPPVPPFQSTKILFRNPNMNSFQPFSHRPPSKTTLLHDPWPPETKDRLLPKAKFYPHPILQKALRGFIGARQSLVYAPDCN